MPPPSTRHHLIEKASGIDPVGKQCKLHFKEVCHCEPVERTIVSEKGGWLQLDRRFDVPNGEAEVWLGDIEKIEVLDRAGGLQS
jgi:hypothetical protein